MNLHNLKPAKGSIKTKKRVGRGQGAGTGGTSTRGHKGAKSRSGYSVKVGFEGGQMPLQRRLPKFGFNNIHRVAYKAINLSDIQALVEKTNATIVNLELLTANGLASKNDIIKILAGGELTKTVEVTAHNFSKSAIEAIEKVGGKAIKL
ncbi:MAG: 50S ribosomal protein L15 [Microscillaceae bacterium]|jgi:large subunit ribosomal protein L15|nr:50S ribosomal protein L15 [Microscillaceae bacterium]